MNARYLSESGEYIYGELLGVNENSPFEFWINFDEGTYSITIDLIEVEMEPGAWLNLADAINYGYIEL